MDRKLQIIDAAAILFKEKGYDRTSLQDIAVRVGVHKATLYHYFKSKDEILYTVIHTLMAKGITELTRVVQLSVSPEEKVHLAFNEHFSSYLSRFPDYGVLLHEKTSLLPPKKENEIRQEFRVYFALWKQIIVEGIDRGAFRQDMNPSATVYAALGMSNWVYKWFSPEGELTLNEINALFDSIFLKGVLPRK